MNKDLNKIRISVRPFRGLYLIIIAIIGFHWFGWYGVLLTMLPQFDAKLSGE
jgi:hypothetical protein